MDEGVVYWLFDETCSDPEKDGYIGITKHPIAYRIAQHRHNRRFPKGFQWSILFRGAYEECRQRETQLRPNNHLGWNRARGGATGTFGYKYPTEARANQSKSQKGRIISPEHRRKISEGLKGHKRTEESRAKQSVAMKGRPKTEEQKRKMRETALTRGGHFKGSHSEEAKAKMRAAYAHNRDKRVAKGLPPHPATGRTWTPEERAKLTEKRAALIYPGSPLVLKQQAARDAKR